MTDHSCNPPDENDYTKNVWVCPECKRIWGTHTKRWWAPAESLTGQPVHAEATYKP